MTRLLAVSLPIILLNVVAFAAVAQASEYLCNGKAEKCTVLGFNLQVFVIEDRGVPAAIECPVEGVKTEGSMGPGATGEMTGVSFTGCVAAAKALNLKEEEKANGCGKVLSVKADNLPWKTPISEGASNNWWVLIEKGASAQPGFEIECETAGLKIKDTCTSGTEDLLVLVEDLAAEGSEPALLTVIFSTTLLSAAEAGKCSLGGAEQGFSRGELLGEGWTGTAAEALAIN